MKTLFMTLVVLIFGFVPLLLLLVWVERNMAIPGLGSLLMEKGLGLPWIFIDGGTSYGIIANIALLSTFGIAQLVLSRLPLPRLETFFPFPVNLLAVIDGGFSALILMGLWQPTGIVLYQLIPSALAASLISFFLFWGFLGIAWKTGRIPLFTALAFFLTPMMSLDRLIFGAFAVALASMLHFHSRRGETATNGHSK